MNGTKEFRFIGVNAPNLTGPYDGYKNTNPSSGYIYDPIELTFEMEAQFEEMSQMGITVFRTWGITVEDGKGEYEALVKGPKEYNETAFRKIDKMLELANRYQMKVILCLVKENRYWGGTDSFAKLYESENYYEDEKAKEGFKHLLKTFADRVNHFTGISYKEDKAILAWEFGNEVPNEKGAWIQEMGIYMKSLDPNHLIGDSRRANGLEQMMDFIEGITQTETVIDLVKSRKYPNYNPNTSVDELWEVCKGVRPLYFDEFQRLDDFDEVVEEIYNSGSSGGLLWSLMKPQVKGGIGGHALFHSYSWGGSRWPGFASGDYFNESKNLQSLRDYSYKIQGKPIPPIVAPTTPPYLYPSLREDAVALKWRISPGARFYDVERSEHPDGPWKRIKSDLDISFDLYFYPLFSDTDIKSQKEYYYRVIGKNQSGKTPPSNVIGPLSPSVNMWMDNLKDFTYSLSHSQNLVINSETWPRLRKTEEDYYQAERVANTGNAELVYHASNIQWAQIITFSEKVETINIQYSKDGTIWKDLPNGAILITHRPAYESQISGMKDNTIDKFIYDIPALPKDCSFIKIQTGNENSENTFPWIGRVHLGTEGDLISGDS